MKRLIVNADDFGLSRGVNEGIIEAYRKGIVRSATILSNSPCFEDAVDRAQQNPELGIGCHLSLIGGRALAPRNQVPNLAERNGMLPRSWAQLLIKLTRGIPHVEMVAEFSAQLDRVRRAGLRPTHIDTHKHIHVIPWILTAAIEAASRFSIPAIRNPFDSLQPSYLWSAARQLRRLGALKRFLGGMGTRMFSPAFEHAKAAAHMRAPDHFFGVALTGSLQPDLLEAVLRGLPQGVSELMCHPGYADEDLRREDPRQKLKRETELRALTDSRVLETLQECRVELINYRLLISDDERN